MLSHFSCVQLFVTLWTVGLQAPLSMGFSRQEYWSGWPCPPPGHLPDPGMEPVSLMSPALVGGFFTTGANSATCSLEGKVSPYLGTTDQNGILKNPLKNTLLSCICDFSHLRDFYLPAPPCPIPPLAFKARLQCHLLPVSSVLKELPPSRVSTAL